MKITLVSPNGIELEKEIEGFTFDSRTGQKTVLSKQIETISFFDFSKLVILDQEGTAPYYMAFGYVHIIGDEAKVLAQLISQDKESIHAMYERIQKKRNGAT